MLFFEYSNPVHTVYADMIMVTRIVRNLLDNALKHTLSGGTITVLVSVRDNDVLIQIIDTGNGIPHISIPYIFNPFYQVRKNDNGSGLGLYILKQLVELQGGSIWMESIHGKGTSVSFTLPEKTQLVNTEHYEE
jgi:two-component system sensor histidine kinase VicK